MVKYSEHDRETLIRWFPNLKNDSHFKITSNCTPEYNCIAWALGMNDVWIGLDHPNNYPWAWWPQGIPCNEKKESLISLFQHFGFKITDNPNPENNFDKVALYANHEGWTHAARVIGEGILHSKIGTAWDIHHSGGNLFTETEYGSIYVYMRRAISDRYITNTRKPQIGEIII